MKKVLFLSSKKYTQRAQDYFARVRAFSGINYDHATKRVFNDFFVATNDLTNIKRMHIARRIPEMCARVDLFGDKLITHDSPVIYDPVNGYSNQLTIPRPSFVNRNDSHEFWIKSINDSADTLPDVNFTGASEDGDQSFLWNAGLLKMSIFSSGFNFTEINLNYSQMIGAMTLVSSGYTVQNGIVTDSHGGLAFTDSGTDSKLYFEGAGLIYNSQGLYMSDEQLSVFSNATLTLLSNLYDL